MFHVDFAQLIYCAILQWIHWTLPELQCFILQGGFVVLYCMRLRLPPVLRNYFSQQPEVPKRSQRLPLLLTYRMRSPWCCIRTTSVRNVVSSSSVSRSQPNSISRADREDHIGTLQEELPHDSVSRPWSSPILTPTIIFLTKSTNRSA